MGFFVNPPREKKASRGETEKKLIVLRDEASGTNKLDLYKFYQERVETLRSRLWTMLAWLAGIQGALLVFVCKELHLDFSGPKSVVVDQPILVLVISLFGVAISKYMMDVIDDGTMHIEVNWRRADLSLNKGALHIIVQDDKERRSNHQVGRVMAQLAGWTGIAQYGMITIALAVIVKDIITAFC